MSRRILVTSALLLALAGCVQPQTRLQMGDDTEREKDLDVRTIGDVTEVANVAPLQVSGVGLITGLDGTGGSPPGTYRNELEHQLRKQKVEKIKDVLDSHDNAVVLVNAFIPAGARRGEALDIEVTLPPGSKATSLMGGYLQNCVLFNYEQSKNITSDPTRGNQLLRGHTLAKAHGALLVGFNAVRSSDENSRPDEPAELKRGRIWRGGISLVDRPFFFVMKNDDKSARIANAVAERLNFMFQDDPKHTLSEEQKHLLLLDNVTQRLNTRSDGRREMAKARGREIIDVAVPYLYRHNPERYLRVARLTPLREEPGEPGQRYRRRLQKMLLEPAEAVRAALRLEALGKDSIPVLKEGLTSNHPLIKYVSAEALTYLGNTAGVEDLSLLARQFPRLANYSLVALASLDEGVCRTRLAEMLREEDPALRCAAFLALRLVDEGHPHLGGELVAHAFWLHRIPGVTSPMVNYAVDKRAEIVLYGETIRVTTPVRMLVGRDFTVTAEPGDDRCTVSRISPQAADQRKQCTLDLEDVLRTLVELGGGYIDAIDLLRKLGERRCVTCPVQANQLPPETTIEELIRAGRTAARSQ